LAPANVGFDQRRFNEPIQNFNAIATLASNATSTSRARQSQGIDFVLNDLRHVSVQLERAGVPFTLFDPTEADIPGSFGIIYTNAEFVAEQQEAGRE
jgi:hypothetical protein